MSHRLRLARDMSGQICPVPGCGRPTQASAGSGLSATHCRYHVQYKNRHGSFWKGTYAASELSPYRAAAARLIRAPEHRLCVGIALANLETLLQMSGALERVIDTFHLSPERKSRAALARMRETGVAPAKLLINTIAVAAAVSNDPIGPGGPEGDYRMIQIAKACRRLASGSHVVYGPRSRYDRYPRSAGQFLRVLGQAIERACEPALAHLLPCVASCKPHATLNIDFSANI